MIPVKTSVCYCCVSEGSRALYTYSNGDHEMEKLAALCLAMTPPYHHLWYFHTMGGKTFGFLMDDGYVYFAIVKSSLCNSEVLRFLHQLKDEFKRGSTRTLQEQMVIAVPNLVTSLEHVNSLQYPAPHSASTNDGINQQPETPLQGNSIKQEEKVKVKVKDQVMVDIESAVHPAPSDGEAKFDSGGASVSKVSSSQTVNKRWCRVVLIVLATNAAVCTLLFVIWVAICNGIRCLH